MVDFMEDGVVKERKKTAAECRYFGLLDADEKTVRDIMNQCPRVFEALKKC